jgi:hypothetical protein
MAGSWTEMHGKVLRSSYRRERSRSLCRLGEQGPVFGRLHFRLTKQLDCDGVFSVQWLVVGYGVVSDWRILPYPSDPYLYVFLA